MAVAPNPLQSFLWGQGGIVKTPEDVARDRQVAEALMAKGADYSPVQSWTQGLARAADGVFGGLESRWADEAQQAGMSGAKSKYIDPILAALTGGSGATPADGTPAPADIGLGVPAGPPQNTDAATIRAGLIDRGLPPPVADGFLMNFQDESGLNPAINEVNPTVPGSRGGYGLAQWTGPRRKALEAFAASTGRPVDDVNTQMDFLINELHGPEAKAAQSIMGAPDANSAAAAIATNFLRPAPANLSKRVAEYTGGAPSAAPAAPQPVAASQRPGDLIPLLLQASADPWAEKQYGPVLNALLEQQFKQMDPGNQLDMRYKQAQIDALGAKQAPEPFTLSPGQQRFDGSGHPIATAAAEPGFRQLTPAEVQQQGLDKTKAWQVGPDNRVYEIGGGGVNVNVGPDGKMGTVPPGMIAVPDTTNPSGVRLVPIPGGPAAASAETAAGKTAATADQNEISSNTIINAASIARKIAAVPGNTGVAGSIWGKISQTDAAELRRQVAVLKATATVENLNAMRQSSPTGGALGSVTEGEEAMLAAKAGAIDPNASGPDFNRQIDDYEKTLLEVTNGKAAGDALFAKTRPAAAGAGGLPAGVTEDDVQYTMKQHNMTREQVLEKLNAP